MQPTLTRLTLERYQHRLPLCRIYLHTAGKKEEKAEFEVDLIAVTTLVKLKVTFIGELAERFKAAVLKTVWVQAHGSSNLSLPAK